MEHTGGTDGVSVIRQRTGTQQHQAAEHIGSNMQIRPRRGGHSGGAGRASLDSLAYSSEGSPTSGRRSSRGSTTSTGGAGAAAASLLVKLPQALGGGSSIPGSMLNWLNDEIDDSASDDDCNSKVADGLISGSLKPSSSGKPANTRSPGTSTRSPETGTDAVSGATSLGGKNSPAIKAAAAASAVAMIRAAGADRVALKVTEQDNSLAMLAKREGNHMQATRQSSPDAAAETGLTLVSLPSSQEDESTVNLPPQLREDISVVSNDRGHPTAEGHLEGRSLKPTQSAVDEMERWLVESDDDKRLKGENTVRTGRKAAGATAEMAVVTVEQHELGATWQQDEERQRQHGAVTPRKQLKPTESTTECMKRWLSESDEDETLSIVNTKQRGDSTVVRLSAAAAAAVASPRKPNTDATKSEQWHPPGADVQEDSLLKKSSSVSDEMKRWLSASDDDDCVFEPAAVAAAAATAGRAARPKHGQLYSERVAQPIGDAPPDRSFALADERKMGPG